MPDPGLMPLPDSASELDWSNLVDAAKAFEGKYFAVPVIHPLRKKVFKLFPSFFYSEVVFNLIPSRLFPLKFL